MIFVSFLFSFFFFVLKLKINFQKFTQFQYRPRIRRLIPTNEVAAMNQSFYKNQIEIKYRTKPNLIIYDSGSFNLFIYILLFFSFYPIFLFRLKKKNKFRADTNNLTN